MTAGSLKNISKKIGVNLEEIIAVLGDMDDGVLITDETGTVVFYNNAQSRIDDMSVESVVGKTIKELYDVTKENSPTLKCLSRKEPVRRFIQFYRTKSGRAVFALQNAFPLFKGERLRGMICFVREYSTMEKEMGVTLKGQRAETTIPVVPITFDRIVGSTPQLKNALHMAKTSSDSPSPIMVYGESGTGKELFAKAIHHEGHWQAGNFVAVNCAAIPESLLEGILFGTSQGAFTDAKDKAGLFEEADGGVLFLDELNSMPIGLQAKLLRTLQEKKIRRVGSVKEIPVNLKIISSLNQYPRLAMENDSLRSDLYYRLAVVYVEIPPLRERLMDIPDLANQFISKCNAKLGCRVERLGNKVMRLFMVYDWPGNVRELEHIIEGAMNMVGKDKQIEIWHLPDHFVQSANSDQAESLYPQTSRPQSEELPPPDMMIPGRTLFDLQNQHEKEIICRLLEKYQGNASQAARELGISRQLIYHKIKKHHIQRISFQ